MKKNRAVKCQRTTTSLFFTSAAQEGSYIFRLCHMKYTFVRRWPNPAGWTNTGSLQTHGILNSTTNMTFSIFSGERRWIPWLRLAVLLRIEAEQKRVMSCPAEIKSIVFEHEAIPKPVGQDLQLCIILYSFLDFQFWLCLRLIMNFQFAFPIAIKTNKKNSLGFVCVAECWRNYNRESFT